MAIPSLQCLAKYRAKGQFAQFDPASVVVLAYRSGCDFCDLHLAILDVSKVGESDKIASGESLRVFDAPEWLGGQNRRKVGDESSNAG
jgi:hypothetical protein